MFPKMQLNICYMRYVAHFFPASYQNRLKQNPPVSSLKFAYIPFYILLLFVGVKDDLILLCNLIRYLWTSAVRSLDVWCQNPLALILQSVLQKTVSITLGTVSKEFLMLLMWPKIPSKKQQGKKWGMKKTQEWKREG